MMKKALPGIISPPRRMMNSLTLKQILCPKMMTHFLSITLDETEDVLSVELILQIAKGIRKKKPPKFILRKWSASLSKLIIRKRPRREAVTMLSDF